MRRSGLSISTQRTEDGLANAMHGTFQKICRERECGIVGVPFGRGSLPPPPNCGSFEVAIRKSPQTTCLAGGYPTAALNGALFIGPACLQCAGCECGFVPQYGRKQLCVWCSFNQCVRRKEGKEGIIFGAGRSKRSSQDGRDRNRENPRSDIKLDVRVGRGLGFACATSQERETGCCRSWNDVTRTAIDVSDSRSETGKRWVARDGWLADRGVVLCGACR